MDAAVLEQALYDALGSDADLLTLLGGKRLFDVPERDAAFPYVTLSIENSQDWSTGTEEGEEHRLQIHVWTGAHQRSLNHTILKQIIHRLQSVSLTPSGCHLINMRRQAMVMRADRPRQIFQGTLRYRLTTESNA